MEYSYENLCFEPNSFTKHANKVHLHVTNPNSSLLSFRGKKLQI